MSSSLTSSIPVSSASESTAVQLTAGTDNGSTVPDRDSQLQREGDDGGGTHNSLTVVDAPTAEIVGSSTSATQGGDVPVVEDHLPPVLKMAQENISTNYPTTANSITSNHDANATKDSQTPISSTNITTINNDNSNKVNNNNNDGNNDNVNKDKNTSTTPKKSTKKRPEPPKISPSSSPPNRQEHITICLPIVYGSIAFPLPKTEEYNTHQWTLYVRGPNHEDLSHGIAKVVFQLHPSFAQPVREITAPPFEVTEKGWGEFEASIRIVWRDPSEKALVLMHMIRLYPPLGTGTTVEGQGVSSTVLGVGGGGGTTDDVNKPVIHEYYDEVVFTNPTESFQKQLLTATAKKGEYPKVYSNEANVQKCLKSYSDEEDFKQLLEAYKFLEMELQAAKDRILLADCHKHELEKALVAVSTKAKAMIAPVPAPAPAPVAATAAPTAAAAAAVSAPVAPAKRKAPKSSASSGGGNATKKKKTSSGSKSSSSKNNTTAVAGGGGGTSKNSSKNPLPTTKVTFSSVSSSTIVPNTTTSSTSTAVPTVERTSIVGTTPTPTATPAAPLAATTKAVPAVPAVPATAAPASAPVVATAPIATAPVVATAPTTNTSTSAITASSSTASMTNMSTNPSA